MQVVIANLSPTEIRSIQQFEQELGHRLHRRISVIAYELTDEGDDEAASLAPDPVPDDPAAHIDSDSIGGTSQTDLFAPPH